MLIPLFIPAAFLSLVYVPFFGALLKDRVLDIS